MIYYLILFIVGLFFGSFLNVIIFRFPELHGVLFGRSQCPKCKKTIAFYDLIPLVSYLLLFGRCRECKSSISIQYPIVEIATGGLFILSYYLVGFSWVLAPYLLLSMFLVLIFVYDLRHLEIPEVFAWSFFILAIIAGLSVPNFAAGSFLLGGLVGGGILGILVGVSNEQWMGSGDIKIGLGFGFLLGYPKSLLFLFGSFVIGAIIGVLMILIKKGKLKSQVPFAPFLIISAILTLLFGQQLVDFYLNFAIL